LKGSPWNSHTKKKNESSPRKKYALKPSEACNHKGQEKAVETTPVGLACTAVAIAAPFGRDWSWDWFYAFSAFFFSAVTITRMVGVAVFTVRP
jgi:hypothetical protein